MTGETAVHLRAEAPFPAAYLAADEYIQADHPEIMAKAAALFSPGMDDAQRAEAAFLFVRDEIAHSGDIGSQRVVHNALEALRAGEGICMAKAMLLAALLRAGGVPTGLCYQTLTVEDTPESGFCLHGLNAVCLGREHRWVRLDARGNKPGVDAQFSATADSLAWRARPEVGEREYPEIYASLPPALRAAWPGYQNRSTQRLEVVWL